MSEESISRREIIKRLRALREKFGDYPLSCGVAVPVALILDDVCNALELTEEEREEVLGKEVAKVVDEAADLKIWMLAKEEP